MAAHDGYSSNQHHEHGTGEKYPITLIGAAILRHTTERAAASCVPFLPCSALLHTAALTCLLLCPYRPNTDCRAAISPLLLTVHSFAPKTQNPAPQITMGGVCLKMLTALNLR